VSLRKFLWCCSLSVFLAGLVYRYADPLGLFNRHAVAPLAVTVSLLSGPHEANDHLVSGVVARHWSFWYLTAADRAVSSGLLLGRGLVSLTDLGQGPWPFRSDTPTPYGFGAAADAREDGPGVKGDQEAPAPIVK
jgi:hypothetical protein